MARFSLKLEPIETENTIGAKYSIKDNGVLKYFHESVNCDVDSDTKEKIRDHVVKVLSKVGASVSTDGSFTLEIDTHDNLNKVFDLIVDEAKLINKDLKEHFKAKDNKDKKK